MKKLTEKGKRDIVESDTVLQKMFAKNRVLGRKQSSLWHTKEVKIPREIEKIGERMEKLEIKWQARMKKLGVYELGKLQ